MSPRLNIGDIYWLDRVPPLSGGAKTRRPVVVIDDGEQTIVIVVCVTTDPDYPGSVPLPNLEEEPGATTGLARRSWAVPEWVFCPNRDEFKAENHLGRVPLATLEQIQKKLEHLDDGPG